jgi:RNA polymerase sigma-70 factor (ECF subfamily)
MKNIPGPANEKELIQLVSQGDRAAYAILYSHYFPRLYRFLFFLSHAHEDTEEIIQEIFLTIWEKKEKLDAIRSFEDYLFRMARNRHIDKVKRDKTRLKVAHSIITREPASADLTEKAVIYKEYHHAAIEAIRQLPDRKKTIFLMSTEEEMSLDEIAETLHISRSAVKKHLYAAILLVKKYLRKHAEWTIMLILTITTLF